MSKTKLPSPPVGWLTRKQVVKRLGHAREKSSKRGRVKVPQALLAEARVASVKRALGMSATTRKLKHDEIIRFARTACLSLSRVERALTGAEGSGFEKDELKSAAKQFGWVLDTAAGMVYVGQVSVPVTIHRPVRISLASFRTLNPINEAPAKGSKTKKASRTERR